MGKNTGRSSVTKTSRKTITRKTGQAKYRTCAVVTGASSGIGKALVIHLAQNFPKMEIIGLARSATSLGQLSSPNITLINVDLSQEASRDSCIQKLSGKKVQFLVNVAAFMDNDGWDSLTHENMT